MQPLTHVEFKAFAHNVGIRVNPFRARMVMIIDEFVRQTWATYRKEREEAEKRAKEEANDA